MHCSLTRLGSVLNAPVTCGYISKLAFSSSFIKSPFSRFPRFILFSSAGQYCQVSSFLLLGTQTRIRGQISYKLSQPHSRSIQFCKLCWLSVRCQALAKLQAAIRRSRAQPSEASRCSGQTQMQTDHVRGLVKE